MVVVGLTATLGAVATLAHFLNGAGPTNPLALLGGTLLLGVPVGGLVAGVAVLFEATDRLAGTLGGVVYLAGVLAVLITLPSADGVTGGLDAAVRATDLTGRAAVYAATAGAVERTVDGYAGGAPGWYNLLLGMPESVLPGANPPRFAFDGGLPAWVYLQRAGLIVTGAVVAVAAAVPYDRWADAEEEETTLAALRERFGRGDDAADEPWVEDDGAADDPEVTATTDVDGGGTPSLGRLIRLELTLALRGRRRWWYVGAAALIVAGPLGVAPGRGVYLPLAAAWPVFVWSSMGVARRRIRPLIRSAPAPARQLLAEWIAGAVVALALIAPAALSTGAGVESVVGLVGAVAFAPSAALAVGVLSGTARAFEAGYLALWYIGGWHATPRYDYVGVSAGTAPTTPLAFGAVGIAAAAAVVLRQHRHSAGG